jgi:hypothetical protein
MRSLQSVLARSRRSATDCSRSDPIIARARCPSHSSSSPTSPSPPPYPSLIVWMIRRAAIIGRT